jgi:hypothetical protein
VDGANANSLLGEEAEGDDKDDVDDDDADDDVEEDDVDDDDVEDDVDDDSDVEDVDKEEVEGDEASSSLDRSCASFAAQREFPVMSGVPVSCGCEQSTLRGFLDGLVALRAGGLVSSNGCCLAGAGSGASRDLVLPRDLLKSINEFNNF